MKSSKTMKIEKWHSKSINGIQQEIYATLWAMNMAKIQIAQEIKKKESISPENREYVSINFKAVVEFFEHHLMQMAVKITNKIKKKFKMLIERIKEKRVRLSREAEKVVKYESKRYPSASLVPRRD